jgi:hypothetical protein
MTNVYQEVAETMVNYQQQQGYTDAFCYIDSYLCGEAACRFGVACVGYLDTITLQDYAGMGGAYQYLTNGANTVTMRPFPMFFQTIIPVPGRSDSCRTHPSLVQTGGTDVPGAFLYRNCYAQIDYVRHFLKSSGNYGDVKIINVGMPDIMDQLNCSFVLTIPSGSASAAKQLIIDNQVVFRNFHNMAVSHEQLTGYYSRGHTGGEPYAQKLACELYPVTDWTGLKNELDCSSEPTNAPVGSCSTCPVNTNARCQQLARRIEDGYYLQTPHYDSFTSACGTCTAGPCCVLTYGYDTSMDPSTRTQVSNGFQSGIIYADKSTTCLSLSSSVTVNATSAVIKTEYDSMSPCSAEVAENVYWPSNL